MIHFCDSFSIDRKDKANIFEIYEEDLIQEIGEFALNDICVINNSVCAKIVSNEYMMVKMEVVSLDVQGKKINPVDIYQKGYLHYLECQNIPLVTCLGPAGSGKTHLTMYSIFEHIENKNYQRAIISKPLVGVSESRYMGTLPGDIDEKLAPFLSSFHDIAHNLNRTRTFEEYLDRGLIVFEPVEFMRGRSFENTIVFLDEIQNLSSHELLTLGTRIGRHSKLILCGDPRQVDGEDAYPISNFIEHPKYRESMHSASIRLFKKLRSPITEIFEEILL